MMSSPSSVKLLKARTSSSWPLLAHSSMLAMGQPRTSESLRKDRLQDAPSPSRSFMILQRGARPSLIRLALGIVSLKEHLQFYPMLVYDQLYPCRVVEASKGSPYTIKLNLTHEHICTTNYQPSQFPTLASSTGWTPCPWGLGLRSKNSCPWYTCHN
jgi:hypothetical protein